MKLQRWSLFIRSWSSKSSWILRISQSTPGHAHFLFSFSNSRSKPIFSISINIGKEFLANLFSKYLTIIIFEWKKQIYHNIIQILLFFLHRPMLINWHFTITPKLIIDQLMLNMLIEILKKFCKFNSLIWCNILYTITKTHLKSS